MRTYEINIENNVLRASAIFAAVFAGGCIVAGILTGSLVILYDGVYSTVSLVLTLLSLLVANFVNSPKGKNLPFNKKILEPIVIAFKGFVILGLVIYSLADAAHQLLKGDEKVDFGLSSAFEVACVLGCAYSWNWLCKSSKTNRTKLISAEIQQWQMDTVLNVAVLIGFITAWGLTYTPYASLAGYADPAMLCIMSFYLIKVPAKMLIKSLGDLKLMLGLNQNYA